MLIHCVKHVTGTPFLLHQSEENFVRLFFISVLHYKNTSAEVTFSRKLQKSNHPFLTFNGTSITQFEIQKHFKMFLYSKLDFKEHIQNVLNQVSKTIELLRKLQ